jgi:hypothetical protein
MLRCCCLNGLFSVTREQVGIRHAALYERILLPISGIGRWKYGLLHLKNQVGLAYRGSSAVSDNQSGQTCGRWIFRASRARWGLSPGCGGSSHRWEGPSETASRDGQACSCSHVSEAVRVGAHAPPIVPGLIAAEAAVERPRIQKVRSFSPRVILPGSPEPGGWLQSLDPRHRALHSAPGSDVIPTT